MMKAASAALGLCLLGVPALAGEPVKIGMVTTLSGPGGYLGEDVRDGFSLAIAEENGRLGGVPVNLVVEDDALKPGSARQIVDRFLEDGVRIVTGVQFTNVALAVTPAVLEAGAFFVASGSGPDKYAGKGCHPNYFVVSWQNDNQSMVVGEIANRLGMKNVYEIAPNYQAGKDSVAGFKLLYKGRIAGEIYTQLDQNDYSAEWAQIGAAKPDGVFQFMPGANGITALKQFAQAGLKDEIPLLVHAMDSHILAAVGDAALGVHSATDWNGDLDNPANRRFVADFEKAYGRPATYYAAHAYDTARVIGSALAAIDGDMTNADGFRNAMRAAKFQSVRGEFRFGPNQHPVQDWYETEVVRDASGRLAIKTVAKVLSGYGDRYAKDCRM